MDPTSLAGTEVDLTYDPGFIFLSYVVSSIGTWTSLELLHRRTGLHGLYNW